MPLKPRPRPKSGVKAGTILRALKELGNPDYAAHAHRFFKAGKGEYGEGDRFLGIRVPAIRKEVKHFAGLALDETVVLLKSEWHEARLFALLMLVQAFGKADEREQARIYRLYLAHTRYINNWDLVDGSAGPIVGGYLSERDKAPLYRLAKSRSLWERRIAVLATLPWIRERRFDDTLAIAALLRDDPEDLIHKAVGWMLREVGRRDLKAETAFLDRHAAAMPRTMLRYAIERFPERKRRHYLGLRDALR